MATIRKRGDRYHVQIRKQGHKPLTKSFLVLKDAQAWARKIESEIERSLYIDTSESSKITLLELVSRYESTLDCRVYSFEAIKQCLGSYLLSNLTTAIVSEYRDSRLASVKASTVIKELNLISKVLEYCVKDCGIDLPKGNVVRKVRFPRYPQGRNRRLAFAEECKLSWELRDNPTVLAIVRIALETAMRRGEIVHMEWKYVDLEKRTLHIPKTKTDTPRTIPLSSKAVEILRRRSQSSRIGKVFEIQPSSVTQAFDRACKRAGIENLHFHDLRRTAISRLFEKGLSIPEVAAISGHKTWAMLRRYTEFDLNYLQSKLD